MAIYYMIEPWYKKGGGMVLDPVLNNNSWEAIQWAAQNGVASSTWSVGDRKAVVLDGTVGAKTFSNKTVYAYILGFNHNASVEGNNTIHFQFGFDALTGGNHIAFCDSSYNSRGSTSAFRMNTSQSNRGGWKDSYMRNTIVPAFINAMPSDLQAVLKAITKYTDNEYNVTAHNTASYVTTTQDKVFLLSEFEIFGNRTYANQYEQDSQVQYDYYKNGNAKIMYRDTSTSTPVIWWERSPFYNSITQFCMATVNGDAEYGTTHYSYGFAPAFVVG